MGVLGTHLGVVATIAEPPCTTPGVLGIPLGVLGTPPEGLDIPLEVLGTALGVLGSAAGVLGTSSLASPPLWMTRCSRTKVLVKPPACPVLGLF